LNSRVKITSVSDIFNAKILFLYIIFSTSFYTIFFGYYFLDYIFSGIILDYFVPNNVRTAAYFMFLTALSSLIWAPLFNRRIFFGGTVVNA
jgi:hypothetical protein